MVERDVSGRCPRRGNHRLTRPAPILLKLPLTALARLARDDEVRAWYEGYKLAAGAALVARVGRDTSTAAPCLARQLCGQLRAVREGTSAELESHLQSLYRQPCRAVLQLN